MKRPNFFIVGAPKCATTSLHAYLSQHPEIFMCKKEQHYFGSDLAFRAVRPSLEEYLGTFRQAEHEKRLGEAAVWYLYSKKAAQEIKAFCPDARIIIMLRDPVDMLYSYHSQLLYTGHEFISDFEEALKAENERKQGLRMPRDYLFPESLFYRDVASFAGQVERYYAQFDRDRILVILYDDLRSRVHEVYGHVLAFLDVDTRHTPDFAVANPNKVDRSAVLKWLLVEAPASLKVLLRPFVPRKLRQGVHELLYGLNVQYNTVVSGRVPLQPEVRNRLRRYFHADIVKLEGINRRDLSSWTRE